MHFRLKAFGLHLLASACVLSLVLGGLYLGWYRWPGWYLTGVVRVLIIVGAVDLALGPTLTLIIANPKKSRRELTWDIGCIVVVQIAALMYGSATLWHGRPLYYTFSAGWLEMVQASDLDAAEIARAKRENPSFAPYWYSRPRWIWAPLPDDPDETAKIVNSTVFGNGQDVIDMPRLFKAWDEARPLLRKALSPITDIKYLSKTEKQNLVERVARLGLDPQRPNAMVLWGSGRRVVAVFDPETLRIRAILGPPS